MRTKESMYEGVAFNIVLPIEGKCEIVLENVVELFDELLFKGKWWSQLGKEYFCDEDSKGIIGYKLKNDNKLLQKLGLYNDNNNHNNNCIYFLKKNNNIRFLINSIKLWKNNESKIAIEIDICTKEKVDCSEVKFLYENLICKVVNSNEVKIKTDSDEQFNFALSDIVKAIVKFILSEEAKFKIDYDNIHSLIYCIAEEKKDTNTLTNEVRMLFPQSEYNQVAQDLDYPDSHIEYSHDEYGADKDDKTVHWWRTTKNLIALVYKGNTFANFQEKKDGLYKNVSEKYMAIYVNRILKIIDLNKNKMQRIKLVEELNKSYAGKRQNHVNEIMNVSECILKEMGLDSAEKAAIPLRDSVTDGKYIFISYSHRDYLKVYSDLVDLYDQGVRYWYDTGLKMDAGSSWEKKVHNRIVDENCVGIIFYVSTSALLSKSVCKEMEIVCGYSELSKNKKKYFAVGLEKELVPGKMLKKAMCLASDTYVCDSDFMRNIGIIAETFPNTDTILNYYYEDHIEDIVANLCNGNYDGVMIK